MPITCAHSNPEERFAKFVQSKIDAKIRGIISMFNYIGLNATREMRTMRRYKDQTGNLRSSTGYAVVYNGEVIKGGTFKRIKNGDEGTKAGESLVKSVAKDIGQDEIALVLVAGMDYAVYVEKLGKNVTDSAVKYSQLEFDAMMLKLGFKKR